MTIGESLPKILYDPLPIVSSEQSLVHARVLCVFVCAGVVEPCTKLVAYKARGCCAASSAIHMSTIIMFMLLL